ncbi:uncharacterized protein LOC9635126 isoform X1 [Selaginella moellendorffii]|uniref:uncharacterized protein LOC9635126 isoform X1 n=1 Tax=Selaginella moellendorffii TaxID=88036 RepID=UPI000D1C5B95|nr:uncharacterized protein LOC9635126 isoform X1 [Selaginella moellendorffii]XP_024540391.1 uncharacterized protein LOC9635126 isoform X1 [Selaginella moellendorffii]|eukprot:XP_024540390.1 uncharacterized protein LOC9635126 isoform X1 [Selaginella moellendorffii]
MQEMALFTAPVVFSVLGWPLIYSIVECRQGRNARVNLPRWWISSSFFFLTPLIFGIAFQFVGNVVFRIPASNARHSSQCKILSKSVDVRVAKTCLSGDLSPVSIRLFGIPDPSKFRCSLDYYWVAGLEVEFSILNSSIRTLFEEPKEVLPSHCRPVFADVWRIAESFQANRSYRCIHTDKTIYSIDGIVLPSQDRCKPESPSTFKLLRDYIVLIASSYNLKQPASAGYLFWKGVYALLVGLAYCVILTGVTKLSSWFQFKVVDPGHRNFIDVLVFEVRLQLLFLIVSISTAVVLSTIRLEQLRIGFHLLTGIDFRSKTLGQWLETIFI